MNKSYRPKIKVNVREADVETASDELVCVQVHGFDVLHVTPVEPDAAWAGAEPSFHWDDAQQGLLNMIYIAPKMLRLLEKLRRAGPGDLPRLRRKAARILAYVDGMRRGPLTDTDAVDSVIASANKR